MKTLILSMMVCATNASAQTVMRSPLASVNALPGIHIPVGGAPLSSLSRATPVSIGAPSVIPSLTPGMLAPARGVHAAALAPAVAASRPAEASAPADDSPLRTIQDASAGEAEKSKALGELFENSARMSPPALGAEGRGVDKVADMFRDSGWVASGRAVDTALPYYRGRHQTLKGRPFIWRTAAPAKGYSIDFQARGGRVRVLGVSPAGPGLLDWKLSITEGRRPTLILRVLRGGRVLGELAKGFEAPSLSRAAAKGVLQGAAALVAAAGALAAAGAAFAAVFTASASAAAVLFGPHPIAVLIGWVAGGMALFGTLSLIAAGAERMVDLVHDARGR